MTETRPGPRHRTEAATRQHSKLAATTVTRIRRYGAQVQADLAGGCINVELADQILMAAGTLVRESAALKARAGGTGDAGEAAREAISVILASADADETLAAAGRLLAAFVALAVRAEEAVILHPRFVAAEGGNASAAR